MFEFEWPWVFCLLPLPLLMRYILPPARKQESSLRVPRLESFMLNKQSRFFFSTSLLQIILVVLAWLMLITAAAQPRWVDDVVELPASGRDLMLAVDLSRSMARKDFRVKQQTVDRLTASKYVVSDFIKKRAGDRVGLVLFGDQAYLQTPLTFDLQTVETLLDESFVGLVGYSTAIGDAIGITIKRLQESPDDTERVLILLTDGENTSGTLTPKKAAELAALAKLKIYTIGIGSGRYRVANELDERTLKLIADITGGQYFRAHDTEEFKKIYALIDQMEPVERDQAFFRPAKKLFYWPLTLTLICFVLLGILLIRARGVVRAEAGVVNVD